MVKAFTCLFIAYVLIINTTLAQWTELGGVGSMQANAPVIALCRDNAGNTYATGQFYASQYYVDMYNGSTWTGIFSSPDVILALCTDSAGNIYAAGQLKNDSGSFYVAKYDGNTWSELGGNNSLKANNTIYAIVSDAAGNIYAAGEFRNSSGFYYVAKYDGNHWTELGGTNGLHADLSISTLCADKWGNIYAGGSFDNDFGGGTRYVAQCKDSVWSELGGTDALSANSTIYTLAADTAGNIYAAGSFTNDSSNPYVAKWNGAAWGQLGDLNSLCDIDPQQSGRIIGCICPDNAGNIYLAGSFLNNAVNYVVKWNGNKWSGVDSLHLSASSLGPVCTDASGNIYVGGPEDADLSYQVAEFLKVSYQTLYDTICPGTTYWFDSIAITQAGTYVDTVVSPYGYDNILTLNLAHYTDTLLHAQFTMQPSNVPHNWYALNQCTGLPPLEYVWTWGDGTTASTGATPNHVYDTAGYYTICVTVSDSMGCATTYCDSGGYYFKNESSSMVTINVVNAIPTGINAVGTCEFSLYPNPNTGSFNIVTTNMQGSQCTITDVTGRLISTQVIHSNTQPIHITAADGLYVLQVTGARPVMFEITR